MTDDPTKWRRTGKFSSDLRGTDEVEWFRPSDGALRMFPASFNPNSGCYEVMA